MSKKYEDLKFTDDFMFCKIMYKNQELCKQLLELILGKKIERINFLITQNTIDITSDGKGIRLDVYLEGDNKVYDIEMQTTVSSNLPKRSRYYQGLIDLNLIERGEDYNKLKETYIIFVCLHDPFKKNQCMYTFENMCKEVEGLRLGDKSTKIFLNASGNKDKLPDELKNFLEFLSGKEPRGELATEIAREVELAVQHKEWRTEYMTLLQRERESYDAGVAHGNIQAIQKLLKKEMSKDFILSLGYTEEQVEEAETQLYANSQ